MSMVFEMEQVRKSLEELQVDVASAVYQSTALHSLVKLTSKINMSQ